MSSIAPKRLRSESTMNFDETPEFRKEFKRLFKRYQTLDDDLEKFKKVVLVAPTGVGKNFTIIHSSAEIKLVKAHLACRALKNSHRLRIIYAYLEQRQQVDFIELYYKGDKENEDRKRIGQYLREM